MGEAYGRNAIVSTSTNNPNAFSTYKDQEYGFEIIYPSEWQKIEFTEGVKRNERNIVTNFLSLPEGSTDKFRGFFMIEVSHLQPKYQLYDFIKHQIGEYEKLFHGFKLIESPSSLSMNHSNNSHSKQISLSTDSKIAFTYDDPATGTIKINELYYQYKDRVYILSLHSEATNYENYLPIIQTMVESFHFT